MSRRRSAVVLVCLALVVSACTQPAPTELYGSSAQPLPVTVDRSVTLTAADNRPIPLKIFYPETGEGFPLIVLSHGTFSNIDRYDRIADFWAQHGYVVILPQHADADYGVRPSGYEAMQAIARSRVADLSLVLDQLERIESDVTGLTGKIAPGQYIAAGHSIGTQVAMLVTGTQFRTAFDGELQASDEQRFRALVLVSDPGKMRLMPADLWLASDVPTFMATGTDDYGLMGQRGEATEAQSEVMPGAVGVDRYRLLIDKGDHYFGGLIQKDVDADPDPEGLALFNATSLAFLDAAVKGSGAAVRYLQTVDMQALSAGRATLERVPD